jgi:AcrR family transcriptional regulator
MGAKSRLKPTAPATGRHPAGRRAANKLDKLNRVKEAARELFTTVGYDEATTRQIAQRAGVALGTVFNYATTKRDLLFLVSNDLLDEARALAATSTRPGRSLAENFLTFGAIFYRVWYTQPELSKLVFRELLFYESGIHADRAMANRAGTLRTIEVMVAAAHQRGEIALPQPAAFVAWVLFSIFQAENRRWLAQEPRELAEGLTHLWGSAALVLGSLGARPLPKRPPPALLRRLVESIRRDNF